MARADTPVGIDRARHQDLTGRGHHVWQRRAALVVIAVIPLLGLLNVFGQRTVSGGAQSPAASMLINSPAHVRGGLVFTTEIVITPRQQLQDARLYLDSGWFAGMTLNGIAPQPSTESAQGRVAGVGLREDRRRGGLPGVDLLADQPDEHRQACPGRGAV
jgi:hypothetical protein